MSERNLSVQLLHKTDDMLSLTCPKISGPNPSAMEEVLSRNIQFIVRGILNFRERDHSFFANAKMIRAVGSYCTYEVMKELVNGDEVSPESIAGAYANMNEFGEAANDSSHEWVEHDSRLGAMAEIAALKTFYGALIDRYYKTGYALLAPNEQHPAKERVKRDVDMYACVNGEVKPIQVKLGRRRDPYKKQIYFLRVGNLFGAGVKPTDTVSELLDLHNQPLGSRMFVYGRLNKYLNKRK